MKVKIMLKRGGFFLFSKNCNNHGIKECSDSFRGSWRSKKLLKNEATKVKKIIKKNSQISPQSSNHSVSTNKNKHHSYEKKDDSKLSSNSIKTININKNIFNKNSLLIKEKSTKCVLKISNSTMSFILAIQIKFIRKKMLI